MAAEWHAADLADCRTEGPLQVLSLHRRAVNIDVRGWPHLLTIADPALYKGPAAICLQKEDFNIFRRQIDPQSTGRFQSGKIILEGMNRLLVINWADSPACRFDPPPLPVANRETIARSLGVLRHRLSLVKEAPDSSVLLGFRGGDSYFRAKLVESFPPLVQAAFTVNKEKFALYFRNLCGLGKGASPSGDDLIHGCLLACRYYFHSTHIRWSPPPYPPGSGSCTTRMGAHMLEMARRGLSMEPVRNLLSGMFGGTLAQKSINSVLDIGSGTGYDLASAIWYTLNNFLPPVKTFS